MQELPDEVLEHILSFTSPSLAQSPFEVPRRGQRVQSQVANVALVSRAWWNSVQRSLVTLIKIQALGVTDTIAQLQDAHKASAFARYLVVQSRNGGLFLANELADALVALLHKCPRLVHLDVQELSMTSTAVTSLLLTAGMQCPELKMLRLPGSWRCLQDDTLHALARALEQWHHHGGIQRIDIPDADNHLAAPLAPKLWQIVKAKCPQLVRLPTHDLRSLAEGFPEIEPALLEDISSLRQFHWCHLPWQDKFLTAFAAVPKPQLRRLILHPYLPDNQNVVELPTLELYKRMLRACPGLERLEVRCDLVTLVDGTCDVGDIGELTLSSVCAESLQEFVSIQARITSRQLQYLGVMPALRRICIVSKCEDECSHLTASDLLCLVTNRRSIEISVTCPAIDVHGIKVVPELLPLLANSLPMSSTSFYLRYECSMPRREAILLDYEKCVANAKQLIQSKDASIVVWGSSKNSIGHLEVSRNWPLSSECGGFRGNRTTSHVEERYVL